MLDLASLIRVPPVKHPLLHQWNFIIVKKEPPKTLLQDLGKMHMNYVCLCIIEPWEIGFIITIILSFTLLLSYLCF